MSDISSAQAKKALKDFLRVPFFLFAFTLFIGSVLLLIVLTPSRFPVQTGERMVRFGDVTAERDALRAEQAKLLDEQSRIASLTPTPTLNLIHGSRAFAAQQVATATAEFSDIAATFDTALQIDFLRVHASALSVSGMIRSDQGRSIALLASFVDRLRESPFFTSVSEPEYRQTRTQDGHLVAPFAINITLKQP